MTSPSVRGAWTAVHHAFTSPKAEFLDTFDTDPGPALAYAYDMVCNGNEIGGGSIRIHRRDVQERVFKVMGLSEEEAQEKFGFLLDAFAFGAPPHGGIAFGWDRIVLAARRHRVDPRRHRLPQVRWRLRPADRGARADHRRAAQGGRRRRQARAQGRPGRPTPEASPTHARYAARSAERAAYLRRGSGPERPGEQVGAAGGAGAREDRLEVVLDGELGDPQLRATPRVSAPVATARTTSRSRA